MTTLTTQTIADELAEADRLLDAGDALSAVAAMGVLLASRDPADEDGSLPALVRPRVEGVELDALASALRQRLGRLDHLLDVGALEYEEWVLALTVRIEIAAVVSCLNRLRPGHGLRCEVSATDARLLEASKQEPSRTVYRQALAAIERNWRRRTPFRVDELGLSALFE